MKAFISYSHKDSPMLEVLHKHLAQLQRDGIINTWTDNQIDAGGNLEETISTALNTSTLFVALLSPDYIASNYCYNKEFKTALDLNEKGKMIIVPVIVEPCDWLNTPMGKFKALPLDGKPASTWANINTAFLDVIQNIRKLIENQGKIELAQTKENSAITTSRNYKVKKDFDSIEKMEFIDKTFKEVKEHLKRNLEEIILIDNIKTRALVDNPTDFEYMLVNRNKINTEAQLKFFINSGDSQFQSFSSNQKQLSYSINTGQRPSNINFTLSFDDYHLFWSESNSYHNSRDKKELGSKEIADVIWDAWLESVGIL